MNRDAVRVLDSAKRDIERIAAYLTLERPELAERFFHAIEATIAVAVDVPAMGEPMAFRAPRLRGIRRIRVRGFSPYLLFYVQSGDRLEVVRVLHGKRNLRDVLRRGRL